MKQTSFTVKNLRANLLEKQFTIVRRSFKSSTKPLSLNSIITVNELTAETFYHFRTSELFNIWTPPFCIDPSTWLTPQQPFDWCSWFATALYRNTNKIFNNGVRDFPWLQNLKAYKKRSKNSLFYRRRLGFQKENLMKLSRVRFFFFHLLV